MKPEDLHELKFFGLMVMAYHTDKWAAWFFFLMAAGHAFLAILHIARGMKK